MRKNILRLFQGVSAAGLMTVAAPVLAQQGAAPSSTPAAGAAAAGPQSTVPPSNVAETTDPNGLGSIVVTARRRAENLQTVPVSVAAFSAETLVTKGIQATTDLQRITPGVVFSGAGSAANTTFSIRGQGKDVVGPGLPSVISYFNEIPLPSWGAVLPTFDVSSVQVLKGPQGTLFGRNTTGGAVLVYSAPATDRFEGYLQSTLGAYNWHEVQGAVNIPVAERVSLRVAGEYNNRDGYQHNIGIGGDGANLNSNAFRVTLKVEPVDGLTNVTVYDRYHQNTNGDGYIAIGTTTSSPVYRFIPGFNCGVSAACDVDLALAAQKARGLHTYDSNVVPHDRDTLQGVSNTTTLDVGSITLKNIFGWRDTKVNQAGNTDGLPLALLDTRGFRYDRQLSDEIQLSGSFFDKRLQYLVGGFYIDEKPTGPDAFAIDIFDNEGSPDANPLASIANNLYTDRSKALFGNATFELLDGLKLNGGVRHTWDEEGVCAVTTQPYSAAPVSSIAQCRSLPNSYDASVKFAATTYTVGADYKVNKNIFTYVTVRRGYRAGGINTPGFSALLAPYQTYKPQYVNDVEIGAKTEWRLGDVRGRFDIAVFRGKFKDLQRQIAGLPQNFDGDNNPLDDPSSTALIINGAKSRVQGVEIDGLLQPTHAFSINYGISYLDAKYTSLETPEIFADQAGGTDLFQNAPKWSYTVAGRYELPVTLGGAKFFLNADYYHISKYFVGVVTVPGYSLGNTSLEISNIGGSRFSTTIFVNNVANKAYLRYSNLDGTSPGVAAFSIGEPRMYGVRLRYNFGGSNS